MAVERLLVSYKKVCHKLANLCVVHLMVPEPAVKLEICVYILVWSNMVESILIRAT